MYSTEIIYLLFKYIDKIKHAQLKADVNKQFRRCTIKIITRIS